MPDHSPTPPPTRTLSPASELEAFAMRTSLEEAKALQAQAAPFIAQAKKAVSRGVRLVLEAQGYALSGTEVATLGEQNGRVVIVIQGEPEEPPVDLEAEHPDEAPEASHRTCDCGAVIHPASDPCQFCASAKAKAEGETPDVEGFAEELPPRAAALLKQDPVSPVDSYAAAAALLDGEA